MDLIKRYKWLLAGGALAMLVIGFLLFRPDKLFIDDAVDESLADAFGVEQAASPAETTTTTSPVTTTTHTDDDSMGDTSEATTTTAPPTTTTVPAGPVAISAGDFFGIDHDASGSATVYELDGQRVLRFEDDTDIQNGPDLHVWFLASDDYDEQSIPQDYIYLGTLKGNVGGQNYELPAEYDPNVHQYVLIWCERFDVPFAAAPLT